MTWRACMLRPNLIGLKNEVTLDTLEELIPMPDFKLVDFLHSAKENQQSRLLWFVAWFDLAYQEGLLKLHEVASLLTVIESNKGYDFCLIRSIERGLYVFGNKTFTGERYFARVFSYEDAEYHISQWFDPKLVELVYVPLSDIEYRNGQPAIKLDLAPPVCMLERVDLDWDGEPGC